MEYKQATLEALLIYGRTYLSEQLLEMPFATIESAFSREMASVVFNIKGYIYGEYIDNQIITHMKPVPATWWDAFKLSAIKDGNPFFKPEKIKYTSIEVTVELRKYWVFPELPKDKYPKTLGKPIPFATMYERLNYE